MNKRNKRRKNETKNTRLTRPNTNDSKRSKKRRYQDKRDKRGKKLTQDRKITKNENWKNENWSGGFAGKNRDVYRIKYIKNGCRFQRNMKTPERKMVFARPAIQINSTFKLACEKNSFSIKFSKLRINSSLRYSIFQKSKQKLSEGKLVSKNGVFEVEFEKCIFSEAFVHKIEYLTNDEDGSVVLADSNMLTEKKFKNLCKNMFEYQLKSKSLSLYSFRFKEITGDPNLQNVFIDKVRLQISMSCIEQEVFDKEAVKEFEKSWNNCNVDPFDENYEEVDGEVDYFDAKREIYKIESELIEKETSVIFDPIKSDVKSLIKHSKVIKMIGEYLSEFCSYEKSLFIIGMGTGYHFDILNKLCGFNGKFCVKLLAPFGENYDDIQKETSSSSIIGFENEKEKLIDFTCKKGCRAFIIQEIFDELDERYVCELKTSTSSSCKNVVVYELIFKAPANDLIEEEKKTDDLIIEEKTDDLIIEEKTADLIIEKKN